MSGGEDGAGAADGAGGDPIDGQALLLAGATASVAPSRLPALVDRAGAHLRDRRGEYRRRRERVHDGPGREAFLVPTGHWAGLGDRLGLDDRAADALRRAHEAQVRRLARREDRADELEAALEIREAVVIGRPDAGSG